MKLQFKVQRTEIVTREVPDHLGHDESKRGQIVNIMVGEKRREDLYHEDLNVVEGAIADLEEAYSKATRIVALFCEVKP